MASKKKATKRTRRPKQPQTYRGHQATHTVQELRDHGHAVLIFNQSDKRALGAGLGASLGAMLGLIITDNPGAIGKLIEALPKAAQQMSKTNPGMLEGMFEALGINVSSGPGDAVAAAQAAESRLFDVWSTTMPPLSNPANWVEARDTAVWRTTADGTRHAFALAFDGSIPSACGETTDISTSLLNQIKGACGACSSALVEAGYKPPRIGAPPTPVDADFAPGGVRPPKRKRPARARKPKAKAPTPSSASTGE